VRPLQFIRIGALLLISIILGSHSVLGQKTWSANPSNADACGHDAFHSEMMTSNKLYENEIKALEAAYLEHQMASLTNAVQSPTDSTIHVLPVVFHVIHTGDTVGSPSNPHDSVYAKLIDAVNARFAGAIPGGLANVHIQFCLAKRDPNGYPINGVHRVDTNDLNGMPFVTYSQWPRRWYYNIYVVQDIPGNVLAYATFPNSGAWDGTVMEVAYSNNAFVMTHELGHSLAIHHTFHGANGNNCPPNGNCLVDGDGFCDTPPHLQTICGPTNNCSTDTLWPNSRFNFMSYCWGAPARFTNDQRKKMRWTLFNSPRDSLLNSNACTPIPEDDAGIVNIFNGCGDSILTVVVKNYGQSPLNSLQIEWSYKDSIQTSFVWTGSLNVQETDTVNIAAHVFSTDLTNTDQYKAWSYSPNGAVDEDHSNDTALAVGLSAGLRHGTYIVGTAGPSDFNSLQDAFSILNHSGRICGPTTFKLYDGNYSAELYLKGLIGSSAQNYIHITSIAGQDSSLVVLTSDLLSGTRRASFTLEGANHVHFSRLTLDVEGNYTSHAVNIKDETKDLRFEHCLFRSDSIPTPASPRLVEMDSAVQNNVRFESCTFLGGSTGLIYVSRGEAEQGNEILDCTFYDQAKQSLIIYNQEFFRIVGNRVFSDPSNNGLEGGIVLKKCTDGFVMIHNQLYGKTGVGIGRISTNDTTRALIANNFISGQSKGLNIHSESQNIDVYYNNILCYGGQSSNYSMRVAKSREVRLINNIFQNSGPGVALILDSMNVLSESDHNDFHVNGSDLISVQSLLDYPNLNSWTAASAMDHQSMEILPMFKAINDLSTCNHDLVGAGEYRDEVKVDIDSLWRDTVSPCIGAQEFSIPNRVDFGPDTIACESLELDMSQTGFTYLWSNGSTDGSILIDSSGLYIYTQTHCDFDYTDSIQVEIQSVDTTVMRIGGSLIGTPGALSYQWLDCDNGFQNIIGANSSTYTPTVSGTYALAISTEYCTDSSNCHSILDIGILDMNDDVLIFPNPFDEKIQIVYRGDSRINKVRASMKDVHGRILMEKEWSTPEGIYKISIPSSLVAGTYFLHLKINEESEILRIMLHGP
jgi:hypothetical protein